jgi:hypothetical protein
METFAVFPPSAGEFALYRPVFESLFPSAQQIQRFYRNRVMRGPQGAARENRIAPAKLSDQSGVIVRLIGVLRTHSVEAKFWGAIHVANTILPRPA